MSSWDMPRRCEGLHGARGGRRRRSRTCRCRHWPAPRMPSSSRLGPRRPVPSFRWQLWQWSRKASCLDRRGRPIVVGLVPVALKVFTASVSTSLGRGLISRENCPGRAGTPLRPELPTPRERRPRATRSWSDGNGACRVPTRMESRPSTGASWKASAPSRPRLRSERSAGMTRQSAPGGLAVGPLSSV